MAIEVKVPLLPESISDATVSTWHKKVGDSVTRDENILDLETDKVMLEVPSPINGVIKEIIKETGSTVHAQEVLAIIEEGEGKAEKKSDQDNKEAAPKQEKAAEPAQAKAKESAKESDDKPKSKEAAISSSSESDNLSPSARRAVAEGKSGQKSTETPPERKETKEIKESASKDSGHDHGRRAEKRVPMTRIRTRIAERLLEVKQNTAMLTTFNEVNMAAVMDLRSRYKDKFEKKYKARLGFMSFFVRAAVAALKQFPMVNASIDGDDIVYHAFYDVGIAVSTDRGLVVPILRNAEEMSMADIETEIADYAEKARNGKLTLEDMQGGTFTITNGGVFGSLMATPIINAPQCAILGMHKIEERPVVEKGEIVIRPMMYLALSYDHRLIDGKESVQFLVAIKEALEDPARLMLEV
jgi:2-oxoglutarate dehydrogenase E2 component (dihydrolipoamide succinyltransferase)